MCVEPHRPVFRVATGLCLGQEANDVLLEWRRHSIWAGVLMGKKGPGVRRMD